MVSKILPHILCFDHQESTVFTTIQTIEQNKVSLCSRLSNSHNLLNRVAIRAVFLRIAETLHKRQYKADFDFFFTVKCF